MTPPLPPPAAKSISAHLSDVRALASSLISGNPDRDSIGDIADNIAQAAEALSLMDHGERLTSRRMIGAINDALSALEILAGRLVAIGEIAEDEEVGSEVA